MNDLQRISRGMAILALYSDKKGGDVCAEHDVIYMRAPPPETMAREHAAELEQLRFHYGDPESDENEGWYVYV